MSITVREQTGDSVEVVARLPGEENPLCVVSVEMDNEEFRVKVQYEGEEPECLESYLLNLS